jgi:DnaK suppressor protein
MTDPFASEMRERLIALRKELESLADTSEQSARVVELDQSRVGRLSRMDAMQAQAMAQASVRRRETMLRNIAAALRRIDAGEYGLCRSCEEAIARKRLALDPAASLCIRCAAQAEQ